MDSIKTLPIPGDNLFEKKICLNQKQMNAVKSGNLSKAIQSGLNVFDFQILRKPGNLAVIMNE